MSRFQLSPKTRRQLLTAIALALGVLLVCIWRAPGVAHSLYQESLKHPDASGLTRLQLANQIAPGTPAYAEELAERYLREGRVEEAIQAYRSLSGTGLLQAEALFRAGKYQDSLKAIPEKPSQVARATYLKLQNQIELQQYEPVNKVCEAPTKQEGYLELCALAASLQSKPFQAPQEVSERGRVAVAAISTSNLSRGAVALSHGLVDTADRILRADQAQVALRYQLLANTLTARKPVPQEKIAEARSYLEKAIVLSPINQSVRRDYIAVLELAQDKEEATHQRTLLQKLEQGKP